MRITIGSITDLVESCAPKGQPKIAQGIALGGGKRSAYSPERAV